jgi:acetyltransferase-like isoleucine patch superfamily enzyme
MLDGFVEPIVYPNVQLGEGVVLQPGAVVGLAPRGHEPGELPTVIGPGTVIRAHSVVYAGATLGAGCNTGHGAMIREDNVLGDGCSVGTHAVLEPGNRIGAGSRIHSHCFLEHVTLGERVFCGPGVTFTDDPHPMCPRYLDCVLGATVEDDASIGGGSVILPGVKIGARALVGAGSVVTKDVEADTVVAGNPARLRRAVADLTCFKGYFERPYVWRETGDTR